MFTAFFAKRRLRRLLSESVSAEFVDAIVDGSALATPSIQSGRIEFIFAFVRADDAVRVAERTALVAEAGIEHNALVHAFVGPMIPMTFGTHPAAAQSPTSRVELVAQLQRRLGNDIKIVHGAVDGHFGLFGGSARFSYTFTFPGIDVAFATLARLAFGQAVELPQ